MDPTMLWAVRAICQCASNERAEDPPAPPEAHSIDARQVELAKAAFKTLPAPVRTLLNSLQEVWLSIGRERRRRHTALDSTCMATLEAHLQVHTHCLADTARSVAELRDADAKHAQITVRDLLSKDLSALALKARTLDSAFVLPEDIVQAIRAVEALCTRAMRPQFEVSIAVSEEDQSRILQRTSQALERSKGICERLGRLGQGQAAVGSPLPDAVQDMELRMQPEQHPVAVPSVRRLENADEAFAIDTRHAARALLSKAQALMASVTSTVLVDDQMATARRSVQHFLKSVRAVEPVPLMKDVVADASLAQADKDLQREIKFVVQTISTDKRALDQVLRCIAIAVLHEEAQYALERHRMWTSALNAWCLQLELNLK